MAKVQVIQKSRKAYKCSKCGEVIPAGSKYFKGEINFGPTIIRCCKCGLQHWEVTTSDYTLSVGSIVNCWQDDIGVYDGTAEEIISQLESIKDDQQERLDNMPEQLQESDSGQLIQERIDALESAISDLEAVAEDVEDMKSDAVSEVMPNQDDYDEDADYDFDELIDTHGEDSELGQALKEAFNEAMSDAVIEALEQLEY